MTAINERTVLQYNSCVTDAYFSKDAMISGLAAIALATLVNTPSAKAEGFSRLRVPLLVPQLRCVEGF